MEFENLATAYDGRREDEFDGEHFTAWKEGETGFPMVDTCMRAMLMSFSSYHLWQHWRRPGQWLARQFLDLEPGIHWPQVQMQSGTTGVNAIRIYNSTTQVRDHDPEGPFIREWGPELQDVPSDCIDDPSEMPRMVQTSFGCVIAKSTPNQSSSERPPGNVRASGSGR